VFCFSNLEKLFIDHLNLTSFCVGLNSDLKVGLSHDSGAHVERREGDAPGRHVSQMHEQWCRHHKVGNKVRVAVELTADDRKGGMAVGGVSSYGPVHYVGYAGGHV